MKNAFKKISCLVLILSCALPVTATAKTHEVLPLNSNKNYVKITENQILNEQVLVELTENEPLQIEFPDGRIETLTYRIEDASNNTRSAVRKKALVDRSIRTATVTLWGYAIWEDRTVSFDGDCYLDYSGTNTSVSERNTWIVNRTGSNNTYAKARTRGDCATTEPYTNITYYDTFDFEMWLDPADSSRSIIQINI